MFARGLPQAANAPMMPQRRPRPADQKEAPMRPQQRLLTLVAAISSLALGAGAQAEPVTADDLLNAQANAGAWLMYGRDYRNPRYSPLSQVTKENVAELKPVFAYSTGGRFAGLEATPIFHDGTLYFSADYSRVFALDARTGT